jgi:hypothetical protein
MASVNKVTLLGNAGRDPEMRTFSSGDKVANPLHHRRSSLSGCTHRNGVISRSRVSLTMWTGGAYRPLLHDRHFSTASSFQIGVSDA